ncbi:Usp domain-containing protein, partial [Haematococcus lacustris]
MHLVHVVCDPRALASSGPRDLVAPSLQDYFGRLVAHVQAAVEAQCAELLVGIPYKIAELVLDRVQEVKARMLVVASHGPGKGGGAQADFGSVARYCYQHAPLPLVLVPGGLPVEELRTGGQDPLPATSEVREAAAGMSMVVVLNYGRQGMVRESLEGSVASELVRHMPPVPLVLLEPAQSA